MDLNRLSFVLSEVEGRARCIGFGFAQPEREGCLD